MMSRRWRSLVERLRTFSGEHEKALLALLSVIIVISGAFWFRQFSAGAHGPMAGGTFIDGVIGGKSAIEDEAARLTKTGLFTFDSHGNLQNQLVKSWTVSDDKTQYHFTLLPNVPTAEIRADLVENSQALGPAIVTTDRDEVTVTLQSADPSLPFLLTQPLFDFGPYQISKLSDQTAILVRSTRTNASSAYINRVIIDAFPNQSALISAVKQQKVDGAMITGSVGKISGYSVKTFNLPRYYTVFFNLNRAPFKTQSFGQAVASDSSIPNQAFTLTAPSSQPYATLAHTLVAKWQAAGASVTLDLEDQTKISEQIAPSRNFQALLGGADYGYELDPYYLWNSSQIRPPGNNLTGLKSDQTDAVITQIEATASAAGRQQQITALNQNLQSQGVAAFVEQEHGSYIVANDIRSVSPWAPDSDSDWLQAFGLWSVK